MDLTDALHSCRCGAFIRDDSGTMKVGWKLKFFPNENTLNMSRPIHMREGQYVYVRPTGEDAHVIIFNKHHQASWQWTTVHAEYPNAPLEKTS